MRVRVTLGEKLRDLRDERKLKLADVSEATGIPVSTLQRFEADEDIRIGYQDISVLAKFYDVSADYLFGLTDLRQYRNVEIDKLQLSDEAIAILTDGKLNNRLISELLSHADFPQLLNALEIYIDRKVLPQMNTINSMYQYAEQTIKENADIAERDEILMFLQQAVIDEDEYLRYRISERFNMVVETHKTDKLSQEQADMLADMKEQVQTYIDTQKSEATGKAKAILLCKQLGLNASKLTDEEWHVLMRVLESSSPIRKGEKRK